MSRRSEPGLAFLLFVAVLLSFSVLAQVLVWAPHRPSTRSLAPLFAAAIASQLVYLVARFWFWRLARHETGASALLWSALLGCSALAASLVLGRLLDSSLGPEIPQGVTWAVAYGYQIAGSLGCLLFARGLWRAGLAPAWIAVVGAAAAIAPFGFAQQMLFPGSPPLIEGAGWALTAIFLVALGISLLRRPVETQVAPAT